MPAMPVTTEIVDDVAVALAAAGASAPISRRRQFEVMTFGERRVTISDRLLPGGGSTVVRVFTEDPEVHVGFRIETWNGVIQAEASFSNMPASVVAAAIMAAFDLAEG